MTRLAHALGGPRLLLTAEIDPPRGSDLARTADRARRLAPLVDAVNVTDGSLARVRMAGLVAAALLQREAGVETVAHVTCRDRNRIALQADLLAAWALGLRHLLALTGDPPTQGDEPEARAVNDLDAGGLLRLVGALNGGHAAGGSRLEGTTAFVAGCSVNPGAADLEAEIGKLKGRVSAGARFCQTQPVFDPAVALRFEAARRGRADVPVLYGLMPLSGLQAALRIAAIPGMAVPERLLERLREAGPEREAEEGLRAACEVAETLAPHVAGLHVFPLGRVRTVAALAEAVGPHRRTVEESVTKP